MSDIDGDAELFDALEEWDGVEGQSDFAGCAAAVPIGSVVCQSDGSEAMFVEFADGVGYEDGVSAFHGLNEAEGGLGAAILPVGEVLLEAVFGADGAEVSGFFHSAVPCEVCMGHSVAGLGGGPAEGVVDFLFLACEECGEAECEFCGFHFRKAESGSGASRIGHAEGFFLGAQIVD